MKDGLSWYDKLDRCHPYPAKYPLSLATKYILKYTGPYDVVYDPFVGSGTTLLSASLNDRISYGTDINAIAVLLSEFKLIDYSEDDIKRLEEFIHNLNDLDACLEFDTYYNFKGIDHWFCDDAIRALSYIKRSIELEFKNDYPLALFCKVTLSSIINIVSNQESDTRYAAIEKKNVNLEYILKVYEKKFNTLLAIVSHIKRTPNVLSKSKAYLHDSKKATEIINTSSVDFIVTSPPYPNTYDYYLYHKQRMLWLGYDFVFSKESEIGSRNEFSSRKKPESNFTNDLFSIFSECDKTLKDDSHVVIVIGDGVIRGNYYDSSKHTIKTCESLGWGLIEAAYTLLDQTSRSFNSGFRTKGKKEHILVFEKK